jgi:glucose-1-phosphate cytidylyltransferase
MHLISILNMKVVILAGGIGSRLSEETILKPKPMVEIGGKPILWHIMKTYSYYGFNDFIILCGYKGYMIKEYFSNYNIHMSDMTVDLANNTVDFHAIHSEPWKVTLIDTGAETMTGGRIKKIEKYLENKPFMLTYGDGVSDVDINKLLETHQKHGKSITITAVQPEGRFGSLVIDDMNKVTNFIEKPKGDNVWINGGYFVCEPKILSYIKDDTTIFERDPLENLSKAGELYTYKHYGFWKPMDTLRDKYQLEEFIESKNAPWIKW